MGDTQQTPQTPIESSDSEPNIVLVQPGSPSPNDLDSEPEPLKPSEPETTNHEGIKSIVSTVVILVLAPLIALLLTAFIFQSYAVDGQSMETTLQDQDRLIVLKLPRTIARITRHPYLPNRGDVIIFNARNLYETDGSQVKQLIKRVVGLPGDRVVIKSGHLKVFNQQHPKGFNPDTSLPYGQVIISTIGNVDITVPQNSIYVLGDNRGNSIDSRVFGPVQLSDVVGKLYVRIFPFSKAKIF